jgi:hypothetical protein
MPNLDGPRHPVYALDIVIICRYHFGVGVSVVEAHVTV